MVTSDSVQPGQAYQDACSKRHINPDPIVHQAFISQVDLLDVSSLSSDWVRPQPLEVFIVSRS